jgi:hypothetical protein
MHCLFFTLNILIVALIPSGDVGVVQNKSDNSTNNEVFARPQSSGNNILGWITIAIYVAFKVTNEFQKVYMLYGLVRSPLYSALSS